MKQERSGQYTIETDGRTVWVNHAIVGAVGRFSPIATDIHNRENNGCVDCGSHRGDAQAWVAFQLGMMSTHGVMVPDDFKPEWV